MRRAALALALVALLGAACGGGTAPAASEPQFETIGTLTGGDPLPAATLPYLDAEGALSTDALMGKPAIINFWASWCVFCVEEMPDFESVHRELADEVRFVGVDREDSHDKARALAEETGVTYELVTDDDGSYFRAVKGRGMPTTVFVDAEGVIVYRHAGPVTAEQLRDLITEYLAV